MPKGTLVRAPSEHGIGEYVEREVDQLDEATMALANALEFDAYEEEIHEALLAARRLSRAAERLAARLAKLVVDDEH